MYQLAPFLCPSPLASCPPVGMLAGFESILEGIYGPLLLRDLNLFDDCEPEEVDDWSSEASSPQCSFCNLPVDKLCSDHLPAATSPLSSLSGCSPCQAPAVSESSLSAHRILQAVFHKKDVPLGCDTTIPPVAQELMKKMIHQFALEYASKCLLHTSTNGVTTRTSSPLSQASDAPLDLTVSRSGEEKECESDPDGVLDLSNKNSASSAASSTSSNQKASGSLLPSCIEELGDPGQQRTAGHQSTALGAVLRTLCSAHRSLIYQMLKLARQERLWFLLNPRPVGLTESHCCQCGVNPQHIVSPDTVPLGESKSSNASLYYPLIDCDTQACGSIVCHPGDSKSNRSIHHFPIPDCASSAPLCSGYCCVQSCRMETYTVLSPKRLHCISCQSLAVGGVDGIVCSLASSPSLSKSPSRCTPSSSLFPVSSVCYDHHCSCPSKKACLVQFKNTIEVVKGDPPCPVLKREHSPSPPPLSPMPLDINKKTDEKPPSLLHHRQEEDADRMVEGCLMNAGHRKADVVKATKDEPEYRNSRSSGVKEDPGGTSIQDVVNRFSEKLETIGPIEKDPPLVEAAVSISGKEIQKCPSTSETLQCQADAHLTEIITTVLHTDNASDYNLSELFDRHENKEPKSPNTRSRRRQEVLAAIATPADDAATRRQTLQIKRELAMFDQGYSKRKAPQAKRARLKDQSSPPTRSFTSPDSNPVKEENTNEMAVVLEPVENHGVMEAPLNILTAECERDQVKEETQTAVLTAEVQIIRAEHKERDIFGEENYLTLSHTQLPTSELQSRKYGKQDTKGDNVPTQVATVSATSTGHRTMPCEGYGKSDGPEGGEPHEEAPPGQSLDSESKPGNGKHCHSPLSDRQKCEPHHSEDTRRSRRNIVPPHRFSSYVIEPWKKYNVACFPESSFNQGTQKDDVFTSPSLGALSEDPDAEDSQFESRSEAPLSLPDHTWKLSFESTHKEQCGPSYSASTGLSKKQFLAAKDKSPTRQSSDSETNGSDFSAKPFGRLRSSPKRLQCSKTRTPKNLSNTDINLSAARAESLPYSQVQYTSPIKLMFFSPVKDMEGVKYSLKSAYSGSSTQEPFDPCIESSWSGTVDEQKRRTEPLKLVSSPHKSVSSPARSASTTKSAPSSPKSVSSPARSASSSRSSTKSASSPAKSSSSSPKIALTPTKSASSLKSVSSSTKSASSPARSSFTPKSSSSSPKIGSRRSGEGTPTKRGSESQTSGVSTSFHETTPKRRPGRPKKLGPQLEKKVKRPIGRPRKEKTLNSVIGAKTVDGKSVLAPEVDENVNKNLKITVVYGRSRRNKRMVSEGFDQLQTEFHDAWQAVGLKGDLGVLMQNSKTSSGNIKAASTELPEEFNFVGPVKDSALQSSGNIKCQKKDDSAPLRKPGRPAKVKISGISVTVTTVSPRQRKILINKDTLQSPETETQPHRKVLLPDSHSAKEPQTISRESTSKIRQTERVETEDESKGETQDQPVAVRHSMRVRKPSIHFLHAVATSTSRSYSHSNALLRRSKQLLLNKAHNERRQGEQQSSVETTREKRRICGRDRNVSQDLNRVAGVSVDSIFTPRETLRWWAASAEGPTMNQELARRIRLISDTWVSNTVDNQGKETKETKGNSLLTRTSKHSSIRMLFDCPSNKPSSCSRQQLCSWFMQTTETQSLAIVKKTSSRNPYELMHFPRSANKESVCPSPQAERLRKHIKKFAKTVPKSPQQHQQAQKRLSKRNETPLSTHKIRRQLFTPRFARERLSQRTQWWRNVFDKYRTTLCRARSRFLTRSERERRQTGQRNKKSIKVATSCSNGHGVTGPQTKRKSLRRSAKDQLPDCLESGSVDQTQEPMDVAKEQNLCSKAWSPETLKECRVFLRKINSPDNESTEEECDLCTVTLDEGSPSAYLFGEREAELVGVVKAVKTERKRSSASRELAYSETKSVQEADEMPKMKYKSPVVVSTESPQPPPAKMLRQSRMRGLTGPRWCDFVFEN
ncbi:uncharacterized protein lcorl isoform 2-T2 [Spinachia spinachia]